MLNSKELLEQTGISRATLNNYIGWGIVPKPEILPPGPQDGDAPRLGYFPDETLARIAEIQRLKKEGWSMTRIAAHYGAPLPGPVVSENVAVAGPAIAIESSRVRDVAPADAAGTAQFGALPHAGPRRLPALTEVAILVAELQHSERIWSELPAQEYFELISQIWSTVDPIFKRHCGTHGKHPGDGMVGCFLPVPAGSHLWNALLAAHEMKTAMRRVSKEWQLRKTWGTELYMNVGLDEGHEWLGSFKSAGSLEFSALARTLNHASQASQFSRFGAIWATKSLIGKLAAEQRQSLTYGVRRKTGDGQHLFVPAIFANVGQLAGQPPGDSGRPGQIQLLPITEIVDVPDGKSR